MSGSGFRILQVPHLGLRGFDVERQSSVVWPQAPPTMRGPRLKIEA